MKKSSIGHVGISNDSIIHNHNGQQIKLHRIIALMDFRDIKKGQIGGYIQRIENIQDLAWVGEEAKLFGDAIISGVCQVKGQSEVYDNATISGESEISGSCKIFNNTKISGDFWIDGNVSISGDVNLRGLGRIMGNVEISNQFTSIGRLIISGYDSTIRINKKCIRGNGIYYSND